MAVRKYFPMKPKRTPINDSLTPKERKMVVKLAELGCTDSEIAHVMGFSQGSLRNHLADQLNEGRSKLSVSIRKAQIQAAVTDKNASMLIWLGKNYLGQKEPKHNIEHSGQVTVEKVMFTSNGTQ